VAGAFLIALALGAAYQGLATAGDMRSFPRPGELVDIGTDGRSLQLHLNCAGTGSPTVILEGGQGAIASDWAWIQPAVAETTRVCAYDRAGMGWSDPGSSVRDARQIAEELHMLLGKAGVPGPHVLVGHSYGGLYVRAFAGTYPADVAGVVFIDASHPDQWERSAEGREQFILTERTYAIARPLSRVGLLRVLNFNPVNGDLPSPAGAQHKAMADTVQYVDSAADEFAASSATNRQVRNAGTLGDRPLVVLSAGTHGTPPEMEQLAADLQSELVRLSTNGVHRLVPGADHSSLVIKENDAAVTTGAIQAVIGAVRSGRPLSQLGASR